MQTLTLLKHNLTYFRRANLAVILGVATAVSVLAGALLVGDSVRASLRNLLLGRLGHTDQVITSASFFRERLAADLQAHPQFAAAFTAACPLIVLEGVVTHDDSHRRASGVRVYGVDERFWKFHGQPEAEPSSGKADVLLSEALAQALGSKAGDAIVLRLEKPSDIPAESLQGRKDETGRTIRFTVGKILPASGIGEFSLRPQQGSVLALFVPLKRLQKELEQESKANAILISSPGQSSDAELTSRLVRETFTLADLGLKIRVLSDQQGLALERESNLITDDLADLIETSAIETGARPFPIFTYIANTIRSGGKEIPYSIVMAVAFKDAAVLCKADWSANKRAESPIFLNEWAAKDLGAKCGDVVELDYFVWKDSGGLETRTARFRFVGSEMPVDRGSRELVPEYPGITESDSISDWDPPFPVDLKRIRPQDEAYWKQYRTTPKAQITFGKGQELWKSRFGSLTSFRLVPRDFSRDVNPLREVLQQKLKRAIDPLRFGLSVFPVRAQGLAAARGATDFGEYFLYFSFFLVISALLLTGLFFKLGIEQRLREIGLLRATGFPAAKIRSLFLSEGIILATMGSLLGLLGAFVYGWLMMYGLRTWWVGAVGTTLLKLHVSPLSLVIGFLGGVLTALAVIALTLRQLASLSPRALLAGSMGGDRWSVGSNEGQRNRLISFFTVSRLAAVFSVLGILLLLAATLKVIGQVPGFFGAGLTLLIALLCFQAVWLKGTAKSHIQGNGWWPVSRLGFRNAMIRPGRSVLCLALIASATFIIVAVDVFRRDAVDQALDKKSGNGGYALLADSLLPLYHDPNTPEGRSELVLDATGGDTLEGVKFSRFRVRPGDDTSCLNLYQPRNPKIIAPTSDFIASGRFAFQSSLAESLPEKENPWLLLNRAVNDGAVPVIADANSMTYVLHAKLGDELTISHNGQATKLRLVAALADSLFQSELLMSEPNFLRLFPDQQGWRLFLIEAAPEKAAAVTALLEDKLSDYGFDVMPTAERLASFHRVENTYLSTFQTLGGLGLLLGTIGLATVLLRNVLERRKELALLRAVGYNANHFALMVLAENVLLLLGGLATGIMCALLAVAPAFFARGGRMPGASLIWLLLAVLVTGLAASLLATIAAIRAPLLQELRAE